MNLRTIALVSGVVGGLAWLVRAVLDSAGSDGGLTDALAWIGLVLLAVALVGFGTDLVSKGAVWLRVIVAVAFPLLVWSVLEVLHPAGNPAVIDGAFGLVVLAVSVRGLVRGRAAEDRPEPRRGHGAHAR